MNDDKNNLTVEEALSVLPEGEEIHVFHNQGNALLGFDVSRERIEEQIKNAGFLQIAGEQAMAMGHGLAIIPKNAKWQSQIWFVKHDPEKMKLYDTEAVKPEDVAKSVKYDCTVCGNSFENTDPRCPQCKSREVVIAKV